MLVEAGHTVPAGATDGLSTFVYYRGRVALYGLLRGLGIGRGDEVATQAFTCVAVPEGILASGATPVWVDIERDGFDIDADDLARRLTPATKAVVVQHTFGIPAALDPILEVARGHNIPVIEDCCHALASRSNGVPVGTFGVGAFYSFEWGKPIVAGVGGAAVVNDAALRDRVKADYGRFREPPAARVLRTQVQYAAFCALFRPSLYWQVRTAFHILSVLGAAEGNYNPLGAQAAPDFGWRMGAPLQRRLTRQLPTLDRRSDHSRRMAAIYRSGVTSPAFRHPVPPEGSDPVYARYPLLTDRKAEVLAAARKARVELADWYSTPIHPLEPEEWRSVGYEPGSCPNAESVAGRVVSLPTHLNTRPGDAERAAAFLNRFSA